VKAEWSGDVGKKNYLKGLRGFSWVWKQLKHADTPFKPKPEKKLLPFLFLLFLFLFLLFGLRPSFFGIFDAEIKKRHNQKILWRKEIEKK